MLQCNVVSHWLGAYTKWSLRSSAFLTNRLLLSWSVAVTSHVNAPWDVYAFVLCFILFGTNLIRSGWIWLSSLYPSGLLRRHWVNNTIASVPVGQPWMICPLRDKWYRESYDPTPTLQQKRYWYLWGLFEYKFENNLLHITCCLTCQGLKKYICSKRGTFFSVRVFLENDIAVVALNASEPQWPINLSLMDNALSSERFYLGFWL